MARGKRDRAVVALAWSTTLFGIGTVTLGLLALIAHLDNEGIRLAAANAEADLAAQQSATFEVEREAARLRTMIVGQPDASLATIKSEAAALDLEGPLTLAVRALHANLDAERQAVAALTNERDEALRRMEVAEIQKRQIKRRFEVAVDELGARLVLIDRDHAAFRQRVSSDQARLAALLDRVRDEKQFVIDGLRQALEEREALLDSRPSGEGRVAPRMPMMDQPMETPDGEVVAVLPEDDALYVSVGRGDQVSLGMTFPVWERDGFGPMPPSVLRERPPKAIIELVEIGDRTSLARVVHRASGASPVKVGDVIENIVHGGRPPYRFLVYGDFDLEHTGQANHTDRRRVERMIERWGGRLGKVEFKGSDVQRLSPQIDFVVFGVEPTLPADGHVNAHPEEYFLARQAYERYWSLVSAARRVGIPMLNQNRFVKLVGRYQR